MQKTAGNSCSFLELVVVPAAVEGLAAKICLFVEEESVSPDWGVAIAPWILVAPELVRLWVCIRSERVAADAALDPAKNVGLRRLAIVGLSGRGGGDGIVRQAPGSSAGSGKLGTENGQLNQTKPFYTNVSLIFCTMNWVNRKISGFLLVLVILVLMAFAAGCVEMEPQTAKVNDTISVFYTLTLEDGAVRDTNVGKDPLTFVVGSGQVLKGFDEAVCGMKLGETRRVILPPEQAYGEYYNTTASVVPRALVLEYTNETITPGLQFMMYDFFLGQVLGEVLAVDEESGNVGLAINCPLAGKTLIYEITLHSIGEK
ncbi:MAG: FKBP-type peptidyl-prolyl cis-trans isomerase [Methanocalculaceae archaeon]|nr:FKBP-type peptidyl-prolyl cis-trans isomerase [Methanocalculaceae archaeon]